MNIATPQLSPTARRLVTTEATGLSAMLPGNWFLDGQFAVWQIAIFNATIVLFAAPIILKLNLLIGELNLNVAAFNQGMKHYRALQFSVAQTYFKDALQSHPGDKPSQIFLERCAAFLKTPPPMDWDGVWTMTEK